MDIIAEEISDNPEYRKDIRQKTIDFGLLVSKASTEDDSVYRLYYDFAEPIKKTCKPQIACDKSWRKRRIFIGKN